MLLMLLMIFLRNLLLAELSITLRGMWRWFENFNQFVCICCLQSDYSVSIEWLCSWTPASHCVICILKYYFNTTHYHITIMDHLPAKAFTVCIWTWPLHEGKCKSLIHILYFIIIVTCCDENDFSVSSPCHHLSAWLFDKCGSLSQLWSFCEN